MILRRCRQPRHRGFQYVTRAVYGPFRASGNRPDVTSGGRGPGTIPTVSSIWILFRPVHGPSRRCGLEPNVAVRVEARWTARSPVENGANSHAKPKNQELVALCQPGVNAGPITALADKGHEWPSMSKSNPTRYRPMNGPSFPAGNPTPCPCRKMTEKCRGKSLTSDPLGTDNRPL